MAKEYVETEYSEEVGRAELPVEYKIQQAYLNGFKDGLLKGLQGNLDRG